MLRCQFPTRRELFRSAAIGIAAGSVSGWIERLAASASVGKRPAKSVILLWMSGGPATIDLWDLKPGHRNGGPFRDIPTVTGGVRIGEHLPKLARWANEMAIIRSMSTNEGDHGRATHLALTGYAPQTAIQFPPLGSLVAAELGRTDSALANFASIAPGRFATALGGGFLGPTFAALAVGSGAAAPDDLKIQNLNSSRDIDAAAQSERLGLLEELERRFAAHHRGLVVDGLAAAIAGAERLMRPEAAAAFHLDQERTTLRDRYGRSLFGQGCLLARRLVERGVPFIEVTLDGWDTHQDNFERVKNLAETVDVAWSALMTDLKERGLLDTTLVVWMGEFGRTPVINGSTGRDHWPLSWATVLAGGGIKGGQVVGKTSADGAAIEERPVRMPDLTATICRALGIDPLKQHLSNVGRPIRIADASSKPVTEVL